VAEKLVGSRVMISSKELVIQMLRKIPGLKFNMVEIMFQALSWYGITHSAKMRLLVEE
jgi:hypothetical protein